MGKWFILYILQSLGIYLSTETIINTKLWVFHCLLLFACLFINLLCVCVGGYCVCVCVCDVFVHPQLRTFFYCFLERVEGRAKDRGRETLLWERYINWIGCFQHTPLLGPGIKPATQLDTLDLNRTHDPSVHGSVFYPMSQPARAVHPSLYPFYIHSSLGFSFLEIDC